MGSGRSSTRRDFLMQVAGAGAVLAAPRALFGSLPSLQEMLPARSIPGTEETLPIVGFGSSKPVLEIPAEGTEPAGRT